MRERLGAVVYLDLVKILPLFPTVFSQKSWLLIAYMGMLFPG